MSVLKENTRGMRFFEHRGFHMPRTIEHYQKELTFFKLCPSFGCNDCKCLTGLCEVQVKRLTKFLKRIGASENLEGLQDDCWFLTSIE